MELDEALDTLYAADPGDFVDRRGELARELKDAGAAQDATTLGSMRKPTLPAWALNQLTRRRPQQLERLLDAAGRVERAQRGAVSGTSSSDLRESMADLRELSGDLTDTAVGFLDDLGAAAESHRDAIAGTLRAAAGDPEVREELSKGRLVKPETAAGFGTLAGLSLAETEDATADGSDARGDGEAEERAARRSELQQERRQLRSRSDDLDRAVDRQHRRAERADERARRLREEAEEAEGNADEERRRLRDLTDERDDVRDELEEVERELDEL